jgi:hypothetical protein
LASSAQMIAHSFENLTPGSASKFLMAAFLRVFAKKVTAEICP